MNRNLIFVFLLLATIAIVNAVQYPLFKKGKDIYLPCSKKNPEGSVIHANLNPFPPVSNQTSNYTVEGVMMDYDITPYKTEVIIVFADSNKTDIDDPYFKAVDLYYSKQTPFSIDVPDVPTPQLPSAYVIVVVIADKTDDPKKRDVHACIHAKLGF
ncbi:hypothetical protein RclHR1_01360001 [Rhizophagus clarus]|uniref:MD-2-related lipid-recognition domain-containing protein n=1 Tax=Rhizophagus clarus TaxID=94130 RepID=A0A2Z6QAC5_9GLOM|nr:hypothetical protein RclHR1_01360001 [Rhizophagus clarus]GET03458.1 hypothetical protein GLOIN_2v1487452 [Rhizophagus clarus]